MKRLRKAVLPVAGARPEKPEIIASLATFPCRDTPHHAFVTSEIEQQWA
ncbi:MAG: hypothetical protein WCY92_02170 [Novosphingobium sp.]|jgi:hypothetical protein|nr:hypothetical protein [Tsuneonella sp. CC-YZS046]WRO65653.1 hypothetical protein U8326_11390 [Tsuneonella sp. CC-YZS046]